MGIFSETGRLRRVLVHSPGVEVEQMTPSAARDLLYNEIVPIEAVQREHSGLRALLGLVAETIDISSVLGELASTRAGVGKLAAAMSRGNTDIRERLIRRWYDAGGAAIRDDCIVGVPRTISRLADIYADERYVTPPLPNLYFTRDAAFTVYDTAYRGVMASDVRAGEAGILSLVLPHLGIPIKEIEGAGPQGSKGFRIEGGDVLVLDEDTLLIGVGQRTAPAGVDAVVEAIAATRTEPLSVIVVELPHTRVAIHLDMIVTIIGPHRILGYSPMVEGRDALTTYHIVAEPGYPSSWTIRGHPDLRTALDSAKRPCEIVPCGGDREIVREREQWFSGCNSFAIGPEQIIVYRNNVATLDALASSGYDVVSAADVLSDPTLIVSSDDRLVDRPTAIAVDGVELARGGGGPRCMTHPISRER